MTFVELHGIIEELGKQNRMYKLTLVTIKITGLKREEALVLISDYKPLWRSFSMALLREYPKQVEEVDYEMINRMII